MGKGGVGEKLRKRSDRLDNIIKVFSSPKSCNFTKLLDIGCGDGEISTILKNALDIKEVNGLDINE